MTRMNRKIEYALMALKLMANKVPGQLTSAKEVVELTGGPFDATARVMQVMAQKGLLRSEQGAHGGYVIVKDLSRVSFLDLIEMILGPMQIVKCLQGGEACDMHASCNIQNPVAAVNRRLVEFYRGVPLLEILRVKDREVVTRPMEAQI